MILLVSSNLNTKYQVDTLFLTLCNICVIGQEMVGMINKFNWPLSICQQKVLLNLCICNCFLKR